MTIPNDLGPQLLWPKSTSLPPIRFFIIIIQNPNIDIFLFCCVWSCGILKFKKTCIDVYNFIMLYNKVVAE